MDEDTQIQFGLKITKVFIINTIILLVSSTLFLLFPDLFPEYWDELVAIFLISFILEIILIILLTKLSKTVNICGINECGNKVRINKNVCPEHDEEVVNAIRNNRIASIIGLVLVAIIYFITK
jgi:hypothetical protein